MWDDEVCYPGEDRSKSRPMDCLLGSTQEWNLIWTLQDTKEDGSMEPTQASVQPSLGLLTTSLSNYMGLVPSKSERSAPCVA